MYIVFENLPKKKEEVPIVLNKTQNIKNKDQKKNKKSNLQNQNNQINLQKDNYIKFSYALDWDFGKKNKKQENLTYTFSKQRIFIYFALFWALIAILVLIHAATYYDDLRMFYTILDFSFRWSFISLLIFFVFLY